MSEDTVETPTEFAEFLAKVFLEMAETSAMCPGDEIRFAWIDSSILGIDAGDMITIVQENDPKTLRFFLKSDMIHFLDVPKRDAVLDEIKEGMPKMLGTIKRLEETVADLEKSLSEAREKEGIPLDDAYFDSLRDTFGPKIPED